MADRKLTAGLLMMPEAERQDLARLGEQYKRFQEADYLRKMGEQGAGLAKSVARGVPQMATGLVDLAAMPFEAAGIVQPGQAVGSTKWLESKGYLPPPQEGFINQTVEGLASALDPSTMAAHALPAIGMLGKTVWHGSPHTFDKFDLSKIGTGEGAQAYGHGLYLAEAPETATEYSKMQGMVQPPPRRMFQGAELTPGTPEYHAGTLLERSTLPAARKEVAGWIKEAETWPAARKADPREMDVLAGWQKTLDTLNQTAKKSDFSVAEGGNLYKVDLPDEQIAKMLDWDKPLSQQSPEVRNALSGFGYNIDMGKKKAFEDALFDALTSEADVSLPKQPLDLSGEQMYRKLGNPQYASQRLYEAGIPGIQYLDQASRGAGEGTRNYVVFSDEIPQILERNGQPIAQALREYKQLETLNPTGTVMTEYNPAERATLPLGKNLTTLDVTSGVSPDEMVEIYRGVPQGVSQISPGDFITTNRQLAQDYAGGGNVISQKVPYRTILDDLTEPLGEEYIYRP